MSNGVAPDFRCTFCLQLTPNFGFRAARETVVPYVRELGVSHLYLSPSLQAGHGSLHGYDVVDPTRISDELGEEREFRSLSAAAREAGLGVVLDVVPNHMAAWDENPFWADEHLRAKFFEGTTGHEFASDVTAPFVDPAGEAPLTDLGDAFWSLNLVDPDNRRPVDWSRHDRVRRERAPRRETMKFHLIRRALRLRGEHPEAFSGAYEPLDLPPDQVGFVRGGRIKVVVPLRPGEAVSGPGDLLQEFPQELSLLR